MKYAVIALIGALGLISSPLLAQDRVHRVAVDTHYPPFSYTDEKTGQMAGFDVDIAQAVCDKLQIKCEIAAVPFDEIIPMVEAGQLSIGSAGFANTEERAKRVIFTNKYFRSSSLFLVLPGTYDVVSPETIKGKKVAVQSGTNQEEYLRQTFGEIIELTPMKGYEDVIQAVKAKGVDLGFIDGLPGYHYLMSDEGQGLDIVGDPVHLDDGSCMVLRKGDEALRDRINKAIDDLRQSGEYDAINLKYFDFNVY